MTQSPNCFDSGWIAELWAAVPGEPYENKPFWQIQDDYKKLMEKAIMDGELEATIEIHEAGFDDGFKEITDKNRIRKIENGWLNGTIVRFTIYRDKFRVWLEKSNQWPLSNGCLLTMWLEGESGITKKDAKGRRDNQIDLIIETAKTLGYADLLAIPEGGKKAIKSECLKNKLFTDSGFGHAWQEVNKRNLIRMKDKEKYL